MTLIESISSLFIPRLSMRDVQERETQARQRGDLIEAGVCQVVMTGTVEPETLERLTKSQAMLLASICLRKGRWDVTLAHKCLVEHS